MATKEQPNEAIPLGLTWGENRKREPGQLHIEWHAPCGCAFHPTPFPHVHPCTSEHMRPDLHACPNCAEIAELPLLVSRSRPEVFRRVRAIQERVQRSVSAQSRKPDRR